MSPPFAFSDVTMSVFPLRASLARLDTFCNNYLNQAPHLVQFKPFIPFVYLVILDYGRMSLQAANMGWVSQREVAFGIPLRWLNRQGEGMAFHDWAFTSPFIFVDNEMSMSTGREVYGWPKLLAKLDPSVSEWVRDPHGARRVFQVSTKRAAHAYAGEIQEYRPFLSVYQHRAAGLFDIPPNLETITKPLQDLSSTVAGFTRLGTDLARTFAGMAADGITGSPILPDFTDQETFRDNLRPARLKSWANPRDWLPGMRDVLWSLFPRTYANTINFKQFRDAGDPHATCYQAITSARMPVKSVSRGGFLGPQNMLLGQLDGGFRIDVHSLAGLPIVESLGLEVAEEREADGTHVSSLTPVCPLWMQVDMTYGLADTLVWRGSKDEWEEGNHLKKLRESSAPAEAPAAEDSNDPVPPTEPASEFRAPEPDEAEDAFDLDYIRTMNFFNTARGATEAVGGDFTMPNASIRVLPLKADPAALNRFVSDYLKVDKQMRFEAWGDFVYLIICDFDQMNSAMNAIAKRRAREINLAVPVKCYDWFDDKASRNAQPDGFGDETHDPADPRDRARRAGQHMLTTGFVSAFSYVDDVGSAITASEVSGIPTMSSAIRSPENDWLSLDLSQDRARRDILDLTAHVLPALMSGAQAQERSLIKLHSHTPAHTKVHETRHHSINSWVNLLSQDLETKQWQSTLDKRKGAEVSPSLSIGQGFALQLLGGDLPINQFSLKQFRDSRFTTNACYQGLVQRRHRIQKLTDLRELEEPLHISITDYPTQPITEILGLKPKFSYPGTDRIVKVFEALRPFSITADLVREAGNTLFERVKSDVWQRADMVDQIFGWCRCDTERGEEVIAKAEALEKEGDPVGLSYLCRLPGQDRRFHLHAQRVSARYLQGDFRFHLEKAEVSELAVKERHRTGRVEVTTDPDLLATISRGQATDIAAFNAQVRKAGRMEVLSQGQAAASLAMIDPATVADSILSRQWGLAESADRRYHPKPDFCVPAQTVPNQFIDTLFPRAERLHGYWPMSEKFFRSELTRRTSEAFNFRSELVAFVGMIGGTAGMMMMYHPMTGKETPEEVAETHETVLQDRIDRIRALLSVTEKIVFDDKLDALQEPELEVVERYMRLYQLFADAILPPSFQIGEEVQQQRLMRRVLNEPALVSVADWRQVEAAIPRLISMAALVMEDQPDDQKQELVDGLQEMTDAILERAGRYRQDMERFEAAFTGDIDSPDFHLDTPSRLLEDRLTRLVTGDVLTG